MAGGINSVSDQNHHKKINQTNITSLMINSEEEEDTCFFEIDSDLDSKFYMTIGMPLPKLPDPQADFEIKKDEFFHDIETEEVVFKIYE